MLSLRETIRKLELPEAFSLHTHLRTWPPRLAELIRIVNLPPPDLRALRWRKIHSYPADDAQGVVHGRGSSWFTSSKSQMKSFRITGADSIHPESITELRSIELEDLIGQTDVTSEDLKVDHIGALAFAHDLVFIPVKHPSSQRHFLLATDADFNVVGYNRLSPETRDAWCAFNDWNGLLYMPHATDRSRWLAFDISAFVERLSDPGAWGRAVAIEPRSDRDFHLLRADGGVADLEVSQGVAFSSTGTVYVTRSPGQFIFDNFIEVFSSLTGRRFSDSVTGVPEELLNDPAIAGIRKINFPGIGDEIEGPAFHPSGVMYVTVAEHDEPASDDHELYVFRSEGDRPL